MSPDSGVWFASFTPSRSVRARRHARIWNLPDDDSTYSGLSGQREELEDAMKLKVTPPTGNVFRDVGFRHKEAEHLRVRADLMIAVQEELKRRKMTQAAAAKLLAVHAPRMSDLMRGKIELFSIETLIDMLARLGFAVKLTTARSRKRVGAA
jgi:predicted XRE-type DNA-binding protein